MSRQVSPFSTAGTYLRYDRFKLFLWYFTVNFDQNISEFIHGNVAVSKIVKQSRKYWNENAWFQLDDVRPEGFFKFLHGEVFLQEVGHWLCVLQERVWVETQSIIVKCEPLKCEVTLQTSWSLCWPTSSLWAASWLWSVSECLGVSRSAGTVWLTLLSLPARLYRPWKAHKAF